MKKQPLIGIITAGVAAPEQKQLLDGILTKLHAYGADAVIFSNIHNFFTHFTYTEIENRIYDLLLSPCIDGLILITEFIFDPSLRQYICQRIRSRGIPVVAIGAELPELCCIDNDVVSDFEEITRHLTEVHHFTEFDILTGDKAAAASHLPVQGCRNIIEQQGFSLPKEHIIYSSSHETSGEALAMQYIRKQRRLPQAIICVNDHMAYDICDTFMEHGIRIPEDVTVIGYEYIGHRYLHMPILTTYFRNRPAIGMKAAEILYSKLTGREPKTIPTSGKIIPGNTCSCGTDEKQLLQELLHTRQMQRYFRMKFECNFEQKLTICHHIKDYIRVLQDFTYLIRDVAGVWLCLYENWYSADSDISLETDTSNALMTCYRIKSQDKGSDELQYFKRCQLFPEPLSGSRKIGILYFAPVFFGGRELGYFILQYDKPDSYDAVFGDWLKIAANGLEALRMKNDLRTLLECRNLSEHYDTITGLYNRTGFTNEVSHALHKAAPEDCLLLVLIRTALFSDNASIDSKSTAIRMDAEIAEYLKKYTSGANEFCAKLGDHFFAAGYVGQYAEGQEALLSDKLTALIRHAPLYSQYHGMDTLLCTAVRIPVSHAAEQAKCLWSQMQSQIEMLSARRNHINYPEYHTLRNSIYREPWKEWNAQQTCQYFHLSYGHFRATYKELFGISFHQDLIQSRLSLAKYLLLTTSLNLQSVASQCGYEDDKYFLRQFRKLTGFTPNYYRNA